jgi:hypothetical protein
MKITRNITLIILSAMLITLVQCKNKKSEQASEKQKTEQDAKKPVEREKPVLVHDDRGNIIERYNNSYRKTDGSIRSRDSYYYTYDDNNNVIKEIKESRGEDGSFKFKNVNHYQYDDRNLMIDLVFESYDENDVLLRTSHHSFSYNENGHKTEDVGYDNDGDVISRIIMEPDETGLLLSEEYIYYDEDGVITDHKKYYYTAYGLEKSVDLLKDK